MKDHKGFEQRPLDQQDKIVLWVCAVAVVALILIGLL